jgi:hypothetical protein
MDVLGSVVNAAVVAVVGLLLAWMGRGRFQALDRRMDRLEARLDARGDGLQASIDGLRSDLTQVALAVGARRRATNA